MSDFTSTSEAIRTGASASAVRDAAVSNKGGGSAPATPTQAAATTNVKLFPFGGKP